MTAWDVSTPEGLAHRTATVTSMRIPRRFRDATPATPQVTAWCAAFTPASRSLLILGPTGTGKTHEAYGAIQALTARGITLAWEAVTAPDLYAALRPRDGTDGEAVFRRYAATGLLLLDDLGAAKDSPWTEEVLWRLVNHRYEAMLPGVFTSNLGAADLRAGLGSRVASRLAEMCEQVTLRGPDRRRQS